MRSNRGVCLLGVLLSSRGRSSVLLQCPDWSLREAVSHYSPSWFGFVELDWFWGDSEVDKCLEQYGLIRGLLALILFFSLVLVTSYFEFLDGEYLQWSSLFYGFRILLTGNFFNGQVYSIGIFVTGNKPYSTGFTCHVSGVPSQFSQASDKLWEYVREFGGV